LERKFERGREVVREREERGEERGRIAGLRDVRARLCRVSWRIEVVVLAVARCRVQVIPVLKQLWGWRKIEIQHQDMIENRQDARKNWGGKEKGRGEGGEEREGYGRGNKV
jgi:hypothetical protein